MVGIILILYRKSIHCSLDPSPFSFYCVLLLFTLIVALAVRSSRLIFLSNVSHGSSFVVTRLLSGRLCAVRSSRLIRLSNVSRGSSVLVAHLLSGRLCVVRSSRLIRCSPVLVYSAGGGYRCCARRLNMYLYMISRVVP